MKYLPLLFLICIVLFPVLPVEADILHTVDNEVYEGKFVEYRFETIYFNVYQFGKFTETRRFPLFKVHKIVFNPRQEGATTSVELEQKYKKMRRGKRALKVILSADRDWKDTGANIREGQEILFSITGSIFIEKDHKVLHYGELNVKWDRRKQLPTQPSGAVIARIGEDGDPFYVGDNKAPIKCRRGGRLFLGINDHNFRDNEGEFTVTVYY